MRLAEVQAALAKGPEARNRVLTAYREGWATAEETRRQMADLDRRRSALVEERERLETRLTGRVAGEAEPDRLEAVLSRVTHRLEAMAPAEREVVIRAVVRRVVVGLNGDIEIQAYVPAGRSGYIETAWRQKAVVKPARPR